MAASLMERYQLIKGIDPAADPLAGNTETDIVDFSEFHRILFVIYAGASASGTQTVTVQACSTITATATTAVTFRYREITSGDTEGDITAATTAGFTTTSGASRIVAIEVAEDEVAATGYTYVRAKFVEVDSTAQIQGVLIVGEKKVARATSLSAID